MNYIDEVRIRNLSLELQLKQKETLGEQIKFLRERFQSPFEFNQEIQKDLISLRSLTDKDDSFSIIMPLRYIYSDEKYHTHQSIELIYVISGQVEVKINGKSKNYKQGQFILMNQNCLHCDSLLKKEDCVIYLRFSIEYFKKIITQLENNQQGLLPAFLKSLNNNSKRELHFNLDTIELAEVHEDLALLFKEYELYRTSYSIIRDGLLIRILNTLCQSENQQLIRAKNVVIRENIFYDIDNYLKLNYVTLTKLDVCNSFHISPDYLNKIILKNTDVSFTTYLTQIKLKNSLVLLKNKQLSITEVATQLGYDNVNYFYKVFKKQFNTTPKKFREAYIQSR